MAGEKIRVAVVMGGVSTEHDISIQSGKNVCNNLPADKFIIKPVMITLENRWLLYPGWLEGEFEVMPESVEEINAGQALVSLLDDLVEVAFLALHGPGGEDGVIQGFFETAGIAHTGSSVLGNAIGMDKIVSKRIMAQVGIPTPPFLVARSRELIENLSDFVSKCEESFGYPCVAKVGNQGSSHNMGIAADRSELTSLLKAIAEAGDHALVEEFIRGRELTCAVIDRPGARTPEALPPTELVPLTSDFFDFHAKYTPGATDEITPARISEEETQRVQELALRCHSELRCGGMSRTDMMMRDDEIFVLEINTIPGMTNTSLLPQAAAAVGIDFSELLEMEVMWALEGRGR